MSRPSPQGLDAEKSLFYIVIEAFKIHKKDTVFRNILLPLKLE